MFKVNFYDYLGPALLQASQGGKLSFEAAEALVKSIHDCPDEDRERTALEVLNKIAAAAEKPDLGYLAAKGIPITSFGVVSLGFPIAPTLGEMLSLMQRFHRLIFSPLIIDFGIEGDQAVLAMAMKDYTGPGLDHLACAACLVIDQYIESYTGHKHNYTKVQFTTESEGIAGATKQYLGVDPALASHRLAAFFPANHLKLRSQTADPATFKSILGLCEAAEQEMGQVLDTPARVKEIVGANVAAPPTLRELANRLNMTERQLRFILSKSGQSYQSIVTEARAAHAMGLLKNREIPISTVAYRLGYAAPANFTIAFKKWTGKTPREVRNEQTQPH